MIKKNSCNATHNILELSTNAKWPLVRFIMCHMVYERTNCCLKTCSICARSFVRSNISYESMNEQVQNKIRWTNEHAFINSSTTNIAESMFIYFHFFLLFTSFLFYFIYVLLLHQKNSCIFQTSVCEYLCASDVISIYLTNLIRFQLFRRKWNLFTMNISVAEMKKRATFFNKRLC